MTPDATDWTRALSMHDLYVITSNTTDPQIQCEAMAEIERRDDEAPLLESVMTPDTLVSVPNAPKTPMKSFRIPEDLYRAAQAKAAERGESLSDVVRAALARYVKRR